MPKTGRVKVTNESDSGRNTKFYDTDTHRHMNREQFVNSIERGNYDNYHVRVINNIKTPCSNPDRSEQNNLG